METRSIQMSKVMKEQNQEEMSKGRRRRRKRKGRE
jgi:hypothetical protein